MHSKRSLTQSSHRQWEVHKTINQQQQNHRLRTDLDLQTSQLEREGWWLQGRNRLFRGRNSCRCFCVDLVKLLPMHRYSVDILSCSGPSGILGSDRKQNTACCTFD